MNKQGIYNEYFTLEKEWKIKCGEKTILLFQVGAFFEVYGTKSKICSESTIQNFSQMCNLRIAPKSKTFDDTGDQIVMAGFRDYQLEEYIEKIIENGFTAVVYIQQDIAGKKEKNRVLFNVYSSGTFISQDTNDNRSNHIMCIWSRACLDRSSLLSKQTPQKRLVCGIAVINISTGKSFLFEYETPYLANIATTYDELERNISIYSPSEVLYIEQGLKDGPTIEKYFDSHVAFHSMDINSDKIKNATKQNYIEAILDQQFGKETFQNCSEFNTYTIATMAFCVLLDFIYEHNRNLVKNIEIPLFNNTTERVLLANHTLKQLNILEDGNGSGVFSSVLSFLNKCSCSIGKRRFRQQLLNPRYNEKWLNLEYQMISMMLEPQNFSLVAPFRKLLSDMADLEKISRQLVIKKLVPSSLYKLYHSLDLISQLNICLYELVPLKKYLICSCEDFDDRIKQMMLFITRFFHIENCNGVTTFKDILGSEEETEENEESILLCSGVSNELDTLIREYSENKQLLEKWRETLNGLVGGQDHVKIHKTEKSGVSLQITKPRSKALKEALKTQKTLNIGNTTISTTDIEFTTASTSAYEIECDHFTKISKKLLKIKDTLYQVMEKEYLSFLGILEKEWFSFVEIVIDYIGKLDVLICRAYTAREYHYCCPQIIETAERSCVFAKDLRHVLIEHLLTNELYVANDVELREEPQGILLFGINSSGKTSLLRSIGISLILAQSGNFVPASAFSYKPYRSIYSRIIGNDNLFKGHSSFAVEMSELRVILRMADKYSMILADEISKGSEMDSAMSITTASIMEFVKLGASFIITSHLHEIVEFEEIVALSKKVHLKHLMVSYDYEKDLLVYDRKLREGSGESFYGLLVCKSLHLPLEFIECAYQIRNKYLKKSESILSQKTSVYNAKKIKGICEMCGQNMGEEVHHILPQKDANDDGFFENGLHKNHVANLSSLCSKCHDQIHRLENTSIIKKKVVRIRKPV